jgi:hypothetical protein
MGSIGQGGAMTAEGAEDMARKLKRVSMLIVYL